MKRITLCSDDYSITSGVSDAICSLASKGVIQAISCMVTMPLWRAHAVELKTYGSNSDIGLHLNFTEGKGLSQYFDKGFPSLQSMLIKSHLGLLVYKQLIAEIKAQMQAFITVTGRQPDFIDGHQHVHHLPQIRDVLVAAMQNAELPKSTWVRSVSPMIVSNSSLKSWVIEKSGARPLRRLLHQAGFRTNNGFAGIYSLSTKESFRPLMRTWLKVLPDGGLIMCHPSVKNRHTQVDHAQARYCEYDYLMSDEFQQDCHTFGVHLSRL